MLIFFRLTYCKQEVELSSQKNVIKGEVAEETVVEGPLIERSANEKTVVESCLT